MYPCFQTSEVDRRECRLLKSGERLPSPMAWTKIERMSLLETIANHEKTNLTGAYLS
jgi:hypothetical protein